MNRRSTQINADKDEPRTNPPSQAYGATGYELTQMIVEPVERCLACEADPVGDPARSA